MLVLNIAITLPCLGSANKCRITNHQSGLPLPLNHQRGQRTSNHNHTKLFKKVVLSSPYLKGLRTLNKLLKFLSLSLSEEEVAAELEFPDFPLSFYFLQSLVRFSSPVRSGF